MKVYNTLDMLKHLYSNPHKRFYNPGDPLNYLCIRHGVLQWTSDDTSEGDKTYWNVVITDRFMSTTWVEKPIPVPWQEALETWAKEGRAFSVEVNGVPVFTHNDDDIELKPEYFTKGLWYII